MEIDAPDRNALTKIHRADQEEALTKNKGRFANRPYKQCAEYLANSIFLTVVVVLYKVRQNTGYRIQDTEDRRRTMDEGRWTMENRKQELIEFNLERCDENEG